MGPEAWTFRDSHHSQRLEHLIRRIEDFQPPQRDPRVDAEFKHLQKLLATAPSEAPKDLSDDEKNIAQTIAELATAYRDANDKRGELSRNGHVMEAKRDSKYDERVAALQKYFDSGCISKDKLVNRILPTVNAMLERVRLAYVPEVNSIIIGSEHKFMVGGEEFDLLVPGPFIGRLEGCPTG
jgi:hypothetical protein